MAAMTTAEASSSNPKDAGDALDSSQSKTPDPPSLSQAAAVEELHVKTIVVAAADVATRTPTTEPTETSKLPISNGVHDVNKSDGVENNNPRENEPEDYTSDKIAAAEVVVSPDLASGTTPDVSGTSEKQTPPADSPSLVDNTADNITNTFDVREESDYVPAAEKQAPLSRGEFGTEEASSGAITQDQQEAPLSRDNDVESDNEFEDVADEAQLSVSGQPMATDGPDKKNDGIDSKPVAVAAEEDNISKTDSDFESLADDDDSTDDDRRPEPKLPPTKETVTHAIASTPDSGAQEVRASARRETNAGADISRTIDENPERDVEARDKDESVLVSPPTNVVDKLDYSEEANKQIKNERNRNLEAMESAITVEFKTDGSLTVECEEVTQVDQYQNVDGVEAAGGRDDFAVDMDGVDNPSWNRAAPALGRTVRPSTLGLGDDEEGAFDESSRPTLDREYRYSWDESSGRRRKLESTKRQRRPEAEGEEEAEDSPARVVLRWFREQEFGRAVDCDFKLRHKMANGYLVGACLAHYYPGKLDKVDFNPGESPSSKKGNWEYVQKFLNKRGFTLRREDIECLCTVPMPVAEGSIASNRVLQSLYAFLSGDGLVDPLPAISPAHLRAAPAKPRVPIYYRSPSRLRTEGSQGGRPDGCAGYGGDGSLSKLQGIPRRGVSEGCPGRRGEVVIDAESFHRARRREGKDLDTSPSRREASPRRERYPVHHADDDIDGHNDNRRYGDDDSPPSPGLPRTDRRKPRDIRYTHGTGPKTDPTTGGGSGRVPVRKGHNDRSWGRQETIENYNYDDGRGRNSDDLHDFDYRRGNGLKGGVGLREDCRCGRGEDRKPGRRLQRDEGRRLERELTRSPDRRTNVNSTGPGISVASARSPGNIKADRTSFPAAAHEPSEGYQFDGSYEYSSAPPHVGRHRRRGLNEDYRIEQGYRAPKGAGGTSGNDVSRGRGRGGRRGGGGGPEGGAGASWGGGANGGRRQADGPREGLHRRADVNRASDRGRNASGVDQNSRRGSMRSEGNRNDDAHSSDRDGQRKRHGPRGHGGNGSSSPKLRGKGNRAAGNSYDRFHHHASRRWQSSPEGYAHDERDIRKRQPRQPRRSVGIGAGPNDGRREDHDDLQRDHHHHQSQQEQEHRQYDQRRSSDPRYGMRERVQNYGRSASSTSTESWHGKDTEEMDEHWRDADEFRAYADERLDQQSRRRRRSSDVDSTGGGDEEQARRFSDGGNGDRNNPESKSFSPGGIVRPRQEGRTFRFPRNGRRRSSGQYVSEQEKETRPHQSPRRAEGSKLDDRSSSTSPGAWRLDTHGDAHNVRYVQQRRRQWSSEDEAGKSMQHERKGGQRTHLQPSPPCESLQPSDHAVSPPRLRRLANQNLAPQPQRRGSDPASFYTHARSQSIDDRIRGTADEQQNAPKLNRNSRAPVAFHSELRQPRRDNINSDDPGERDRPMSRLDNQAAGQGGSGNTEEADKGQVSARKTVGFDGYTDGSSFHEVGVHWA